MRLFEFGFRNDTDTENGVIFIVERELSKAIDWANRKLQKGYVKRMNVLIMSFPFNVA